jgi:hypothetical protein
MTRNERIFVFSTLILLILICGGDFVVFGLRSRDPNIISYVHVHKYNAISDGGGHYHFAYVADMDEPCVRALLPHRGMWPCWWVRFNRSDWDR